MQLRCRIFFLRERTLKMCARSPEWKNTFKLQHLKISCRFCCRIRNRRMFCDREICHHPTKQMRRNGPSKSYYTGMHGQYDSRWICEGYIEATAVTRNKYALFLYSWLKYLKRLSHCMEIRTRNSCRLFIKNNSIKYHKRVGPIYL